MFSSSGMGYYFLYKLIHNNPLHFGPYPYPYPYSQHARNARTHPQQRVLESTVSAANLLMGFDVVSILQQRSDLECVSSIARLFFKVKFGVCGILVTLRRQHPVCAHDCLSRAFLIFPVINLAHGFSTKPLSQLQLGHTVPGLWHVLRCSLFPQTQLLSFPTLHPPTSAHVLFA